MSFLLPHFLKEGRGKLDVYFTRVYNPLWTNPDGFSWMEVLQDKEKIGLHVALTPTWSETAWFADYILPMGLGTERHDTMSQETHAGQWLGFRQPVLRVAREKRGEHVQRNLRSQSRRSLGRERVLDRPQLEDRSRRLARHPPSSSNLRTAPASRSPWTSTYRWMFENSVPGLPEAAAKENLTPLEYMRKYGVFKVSDKSYSRRFDELRPRRDENIRMGVQVDGVTARPGSTRRRGCSSSIRRRWSTGDGRSMPCRATCRATSTGAISTRKDGEFDLLPNFRLPTLIHTRSPVKWLYEISHNNPLWISTDDARRMGSRPAIWSRSVRESATS